MQVNIISRGDPPLNAGPTPAQILQDARADILAATVLASRDFRVNPGGVIYYVSLQREAILARSEADANEHDPHGRAGAHLDEILQDFRGFWFATLRWHGVE